MEIISANLLLTLIALLAISGLVIFLLSPWISPDAWLTVDGLFLRKFFSTQKLSLDKISGMEMFLQGGGDFGTYYVRLRLILKDNRKMLITYGIDFEKLFSWKRAKSIFYKFEPVLPDAEVLKEITKKHPNIKLDQYTKSYIETGNTQKITAVIQ